MSIIYNEKEKIFKLDTSGASYVMGIEEKLGHLVHIYYGKKLKVTAVRRLFRGLILPINFGSWTVILWSIRQADAVTSGSIV